MTGQGRWQRGRGRIGIDPEKRPSIVEPKSVQSSLGCDVVRGLEEVGAVRLHNVPAGIAGSRQYGAWREGHGLVICSLGNEGSSADYWKHTRRWAGIESIATLGGLRDQRANNNIVRGLRPSVCYAEVYLYQTLVLCHVQKADSCDVHPNIRNRHNGWRSNHNRDRLRHGGVFAF